MSDSEVDDKKQIKELLKVKVNQEKFDQIKSELLYKDP